MDEVLNLATLPKYLSDEHEAWALLERLRWPDGEPICPHCGHKDAKHYFLTSRSGERRTKAGNVTYRRLWKCRNKDCRKQFSVLIGTIFESSKVPASKWLLGMWLMSASKNGISSLEMERHLGVAHQTAWFMNHRLREAMTREPLASLLFGTVTADETFVGGKPKNRHRQGRPPRLPAGAGSQVEKRRMNTPVLALIDNETGEARAKVITDVTANTLSKAMADEIDMGRTTLHTDGHAPYKALRNKLAGHEYVDHSAYEYVRGDVSTNRAESYFSRLKRAITGTYHNVSTEHLDRYVDEFTFRWNTRDMTDQRRMEAMIGGAEGKRLTYRPAIGR
jgi:transposase-like protein